MAQAETAAPTDSVEAMHMPESRPAGDSSGGRSPAGSGQEAESGIEGRVVVGPVCPTVEEGQKCPDRPYQTELTVRRAESGDVEAIVVSDTDGRFRIEVPPGTYVLDPGVPRLVTDPRAEPITVEVEAGRYAQVVVRFDSGVR